MFFMSNALAQRTSAGSGTTGSSPPSRWTDRSQSVTTNGARTTVTVRQDGQMPSPVVLKVEFAPGAGAIARCATPMSRRATRAVVTYPVDVWFGGSRTFDAPARLRRSQDRQDRARSGLSLPRSRSERQRVAAWRAAHTARDRGPRRSRPRVLELAGAIARLVLMNVAVMARIRLQSRRHAMATP